MTDVWTRCQFIWLSPDIHDTYCCQEWWRYSFVHIKSNPNKTIGTLVAIAWFLAVDILCCRLLYCYTDQALACAASVFILKSICVLANEEQAAERMELRGDSGSEKINYNLRKIVSMSTGKNPKESGMFRIALVSLNWSLSHLWLDTLRTRRVTNAWITRQTWRYTFFRIRRQLKINMRKTYGNWKSFRWVDEEDCISSLYANNAFGVL